MLAVFVLVFAVSLDVFFASFSYGMNGVKIPKTSVIVISVVSALILGGAVGLSGWISGFLSEKTCSNLSGAVLLAMAILNFFQNGLKAKLQISRSRKVQFHWSDLRFVLDVYLDEMKADCDGSKTLSCMEAVLMAVAFGFDAMACGLGAGLSGVDPLGSAVLCLVSSPFVICGGCACGRRAGRSKLNLCWLSGFMLLLLAVWAFWGE